MLQKGEQKNEQQKTKCCTVCVGGVPCRVRSVRGGGVRCGVRPRRNRGGNHAVGRGFHIVCAADGNDVQSGERNAHLYPRAAGRRGGADRIRQCGNRIGRVRQLLVAKQKLRRRGCARRRRTRTQGRKQTLSPPERKHEGAPVLRQQRYRYGRRLAFGRVPQRVHKKSQRLSHGSDRGQ